MIKISKKNWMSSSPHTFTTPTKFYNWLFYALVFLILVDRFFTLTHFGFLFTDIDQVVMWNGAVDYANGVFQAPFFYGQPYNYMLESFLSVPLLKLGVPVYYALPIISTLLATIPYITLAVLLKRNNHLFWACFCLLLPLLLTLEYNMITTISRGFLQAHLFLPLVLIPAIFPKNKKFIPLLYLGIGLSFVANPSSVLLTIPVFLYVYTYHFKSHSFYLNALLVAPFIWLDYLAKQHYANPPSKVVHDIKGLAIDSETFTQSLTKMDHFEFLFPIFSNAGILYMVLLIGLIIHAIIRKNIKGIIVSLSGLLLILLTFSIPKVQGIYEDAGLFFSPSRLYLHIPIFILFAMFVVLRRTAVKFNQKLIPSILIPIALIAIVLKTKNITDDVKQILIPSTFPIMKNEDLVKNAHVLDQLVSEHNVDFVVFSNQNWGDIFDSFAYRPLINSADVPYVEITETVTNENDRRTWLYDDQIYSTVLICGLQLEDSLLQSLDVEKITPYRILIRNNDQPLFDLFHKWKIPYGVTRSL